MKEYKQEQEVIKSKVDRNGYRIVRFCPGMQCVVVSSSETKRSGAAVSVNTGLYDDPKEVEGLAHFLEHMLFMGTEKYPDESEFMKFIEQHGGMTNAYTKEDATCYYFTIKNESFEEGLDKFARFFYEPLLKEDCASREVNAVDAEHRKNKSSDCWIEDHICFQFSSGIYKRFGTGSINTLKPTEEKSLRTMVHEFYEKHYMSRRIGIIIYGNETLDELERIARENFEPLEKRLEKKGANQEIQLAHSKITNPFVDTKGKIVVIKSKQENNKMRIRILLENNYIENRRLLYSSFMQRILEMPFKDGLKEYLKRSGYAVDVCCYYNESASFSFLETVISLNEDVDNTKYENIMSAMYEYLRTLLEAVKKDEYKWMEKICSVIKKSAEQSFRYESTKNIDAFVSLYAERMLYIEPHMLMYRDFEMGDFIREEAERFLAKILNKDAWIVTIVTTPEKSKIDFADAIVDKHYEAYYKTLDVNIAKGEVTFKQFWEDVVENISQLEECEKLIEETDVAYNRMCTEVKQEMCEDIDHEHIFAERIDNILINTYNRWKSPKGAISLELEPADIRNMEDFIRNWLKINIFENYIEKTGYYKKAFCGLVIESNLQYSGNISIMVGGYQQVVLETAKEIFSLWLNSSYFSEDLFRASKELTVNEVMTEMYGMPYMLLNNYFKFENILNVGKKEEEKFSYKNMLNTLKGIDYQKLVENSRCILKSYQMYAGGFCTDLPYVKSVLMEIKNLIVQKQEKGSDSVLDKSCSDNTDQSLFTNYLIYNDHEDKEEVCYKMDKEEVCGANKCIRTRCGVMLAEKESMDPEENAVGVFTKGMDYNRVENFVYLKVYATIMNNEFFDKFRTKESYGYCVFVRPVKYRELLYICFCIQTNRSVDSALPAMLVFINDSIKFISDMSEEMFEVYKKSHYVIYTDPFPSLEAKDQNSCFYFFETTNYDPNRQRRCAEAVNQMTKGDMLEFLARLLDNYNVTVVSKKNIE